MIAAARAVLGAIALAAVASCAGGGRPRIGAAGPPIATRDELLLATGDAVWRGDLPAAHRALTRLADREVGRADTALDFWSDLLALLRCEPLTRAPRANRVAVDPWEQLRRLVQIERVRLARVPAAGGRSATVVVSPGDAAAREVSWPIEGERWTDELPWPAVVSRCAAPTAAGAVAAGASKAGAGETALVAAVADTLPLDHPATPALLIDAAVLEVARGDAAAARAPVARFETIGAPRGAPDALTPAELNELTLAAAIAAIADPAVPPDAVAARTRAAVAAGLPRGVARGLALAASERLAAAGRADDATALRGPPPHGDDELGRYVAFRQVEAHARAGRRDLLLAEAREALQRHGRAAVDADPALTAIMDLTLRTLLASPVSPETMELLESLGPPRERLGRAAAFAELALEAGALPSATATFLWLYQNDKDADRQLQHIARASVAAARAGDHREFARTFHVLAGEEDAQPAAGNPARAGNPERAAAAKAGAAPAREGGMIDSAEADAARAQRRQARSANWQRALLVVARDALPALVDNNDQADLATLVATLKRHLGEGGRGPVDEELTTLYRAASAHLDGGPRAYAETIGAPRRPILLGDVLIGRKYDVPAPVIDLRSALREIGPLVFVPRRGNDPRAALRRWPGRFGVAWTGGGS